MALPKKNQTQKKFIQEVVEPEVEVSQPEFIQEVVEPEISVPVEPEVLTEETPKITSKYSHLNFKK
jgi:hypothetical protein